MLNGSLKYYACTHQLVSAFLQAQAQAQAQQAAEEACHLDATAQQLQVEAHLVASKGASEAVHQHNPNQQYAGVSAPVAGTVTSLGYSAGQRQDQMDCDLQAQQVVHVQECPPLEGTALGLPHRELDDSQLMLAAAEVRFEGGAAMATPQPSAPASHDVLFKEQYIAPPDECIQHDAMATAAIQRAASASGQRMQTSVEFEHGLESVQQVPGHDVHKPPEMHTVLCEPLFLKKGVVRCLSEDISPVLSQKSG